ncbi:MAG: hypothetical protein KAS67_04775 [Thermoplasmata archaeon]|nr:hypothetical protein [Thermoplasmata archaeon]
MADRNFSPEIHEIMAREMGEMGAYFVKKQCMELAIMPDHITTRDIPRLASALSAAMGDFGADKSRRIIRDMYALIRIEEMMRAEAETNSQD